MDSVAGNPQHYSTLSHALHPQIPSPSRSPYTAYTPTDPQHQPQQPQQPQHHQPQPQQQQQTHHQHHHQQPADTQPVANDSRREEEEEEEEEEDEEEVEGEVDRRLSVPDHLQSGTTQVAGASGSSSTASISAVAGVARRRPGRPKGSKNKRPRFDAPSTPAPPKPPFQPPPYYYPPVPMPMQPHPPPHPNIVPAPPVTPEPSNQHFHDFQWRVLTLCSEFYNAADELIASAAPQVISQCYSLLGNPMSPISILNEARRACDQLLANPVQQVYKQQTAPPVPVYATTPSLAKAPAASSPSVISNPGSFVMPLGTTAPGTYPYATPGRYPTTPYYAYTAQSSPSVPYVSQQQMMKPVNLSTPAAAGNQGAWSDEETEKLKKFAEDSKSQGEAAGEIDWDWVCNHWGSGRTRHQILIKATTLGLKESSTRIPKKRRETDTAPIEADKSNGGGASSASPDRPTSTQPAQVAAPPAPVTTTPAAPPQQLPQPPVAATNSAAATTATNSATTGSMPWVMPHVAASQATSPILASPSLGSSSANRNYYRERTTQPAHLIGAKPVAGPTAPPGHTYYQANGNAARGSEQ